MDRNTLAAVVEAILLTAKGPVKEIAIVEALHDENVDAPAIIEALEHLSNQCKQPGRGVRIEKVSGGWRMVTPVQLATHLLDFHGIAARQRLSQAALEVLAIVAHRQPVTLPEINFVRGANSSGVMRTLLDRKLIRTSGRKKVVGKPFLYRTTIEFLIHFGLDSIKDLPEPDEIVAPEETS